MALFNYYNKNSKIQIFRDSISLKNNNNDTPMHILARKKMVHSIKFLMSHGGSITSINNYGESPFSILKIKYNIDITL